MRLFSTVESSRFTPFCYHNQFRFTYLNSFWNLLQCLILGLDCNIYDLHLPILLYSDPGLVESYLFLEAHCNHYHQTGRVNFWENICYFHTACSPPHTSQKENDLFVFSGSMEWNFYFPSVSILASIVAILFPLVMYVICCHFGSKHFPTSSSVTLSILLF